MNIAELLKLRGLDMTKRIKIVRHKDDTYDLEALMLSGHLETYQSIQSSKVFDECDFIVSCVGLERNKARLFGVYEVCDRTTVGQVELPHDYPYREIENSEHRYYHLRRLSGFEDLEERVVVDWGNGAIAWAQWLTEGRAKEVTELLPRGYFRPFPGFLDFTLNLSDLQRITANPEANREWVISLSSVAGVYLILNEKDGLQYVGSAYGPRGIFGRWESYSQTGHGENVRLRELVERDPSVTRNFRFSVLQTLSRSLSPTEVIEHEALMKRKLGSRAFGLNAN